MNTRNKRALEPLIVIGCAIAGSFLGIFLFRAEVGAWVGWIPGVIVGIFVTEPMRTQISVETANSISHRYDTWNLSHFDSVAYLGGHPEVRKENYGGCLVVKSDTLAYLEKPDGAASELFSIPFEKVREVKAVSDSVTVTAFGEVAAISQTKKTNKRLAIRFMNDVNEESVVLLRPYPLQLADVEEGLNQAIYDWKKKAQRTTSVR